MKRPRIYGNETRCRAAVARYIEGGEELLDQAVGVHKRLGAVTATRHPDSLLMAFAIEREWEKGVRRWFSAARQGLGHYLQEQTQDVMPVLALGLPPDTGKPRHTIGLDNGEPWLRKALEELQSLQAVLRVKRDVGKAAPAPARFEELHASGLVAERVLEDHAKDMRSPHTARQLYNAIGSAKELTEATLHAALDRLGASYGHGDDLPVLMKKWRNSVGALAPPDPRARGRLIGHRQH